MKCLTENTENKDSVNNQKNTFMEINGKIFKILPQGEVTFGDGTKKMKGGFVITTDGEYPKKVAFELFGEERLSLLAGLNEGCLVKVNFIPVSFEGKEGRYYSTLRCTNVFPLVAGVATNAGIAATGTPATANGGLWNPAVNLTPQTQPFSQLPPDEALPFDDNNDLPFF